MAAPRERTPPAWEPDSWRRLVASQQPNWPDPKALEASLDELRGFPPLVFAGEARGLTESLAAVSRGEGFVLQAGDCAESFDVFSANAIRDKLRVILQMAVVLGYSTGVPTVKIGRIAGQYAKPRSSDTETRAGIELPSFRGDMVNNFAFDLEARIPDPSTPGTRVPPIRGDAQSRARVHQGRIRRTQPSPPLESGIRRDEQ